MYKKLLVLITICAGLGFRSASAQSDPRGIETHGRDARPEVVSRAKELIGQNDFSGIEALMTQLEAHYQGQHGLAFYRDLTGILEVVQPSNKPRIRDYPTLWLQSKILWKIFLTPYSRVEDAQAVQNMRSVFGFAVIAPWENFERDKDQFVAMRDDSVSIISWIDQLRR